MIGLLLALILVALLFGADVAKALILLVLMVCLGGLALAALGVAVVVL